jgi:diguanylate cyclase (GGDEF)-like protein
MRTSALSRMQPGDPKQAAQTIFTLVAVASVVTLASAALDPQLAGGRLLALVVTVPLLALFLGGSWLLRYGSGESRWSWAVFPFAAMALIVILDLLSDDASVGAQVFLLFPVFYAASQLHRHGALAVTGAAVVSDVVITACLLPARLAALDSIYVGAAIATSSLLLIRGVERSEALMAQLQRQAATDPLTGLVTRRVLDNAARTALTGAATHTGTALLVIDVDRFKTINDSHGHPAGDEVLLQIAGILLNLSRPEDVTSRMGGDEMALLLPGCSERVAIERAEHVRATIAAHSFTLDDGTTLRLTISVGIAHAPTHASDLHTLYAAADEALYAAKRNGRNQAAESVRQPL